MKDDNFFGKRMKMLVVDDEEVNDVVLKQFFQDEYDILTAVNGKDALAILEETPVQVVMLDLNMPVMDGFEVLSVMKHSERFKSLPVIAMTTQSDRDNAARAMELGAADFVTKPFLPAAVHARVRNVMASMENEWHRVEQTARDQQLVEMHRSLENDALTGIYNREAFYRKASTLMQTDVGKDYVIVYFDISCFKAINDLFRMDTGNLVLKTAAYYFQANVGDTGICGRMEADHFVLCVPKEKLDIEILLAGLDATIQSLCISHIIKFYAGIYPVTDVYLPIDQMCDRANLALRKVKGSYMTRYGYYDDSMREQMLNEQMIVRDMEFALHAGQFCIHLQPIYSLKKNCIMRAEALVRWYHPVRGLIPPTEFIPVFERNGFIIRLDRFIWETVCRLLRDIKQRFGIVTPVSVNISRLNFYSADLMDFLLGLIDKYGLEPWMLNLEITESAYTDNPHQLIPVVRAFREQGFRVLMDDFGSGYSSLNMLKNLPVDVLKIDMAFAQELESSPRASSIMKFILELSKALQMEVVVEGVETQSQVEYLEKMGGEEIQGYYFSKPVAVEQFLGLLEQDRAKAKG